MRSSGKQQPKKQSSAEKQSGKQPSAKHSSGRTSSVYPPGHQKFLESDVALYGMFISVAAVMSYLESLIPLAPPIPGIKIGLANIVIVWVLYSLGIKPAVLISLLRVVLVGFLFGNLYSILFGLAGAAASLGIMYLLSRTKRFSIIGVSIAGGVAHNLAQTVVAMIVIQNVGMAYYLPALIVSGVVTGIAIGILGAVLYKKIKILPSRSKKNKDDAEVLK